MKRDGRCSSSRHGADVRDGRRAVMPAGPAPDQLCTCLRGCGQECSQQKYRRVLWPCVLARLSCHRSTIMARRHGMNQATEEENEQGDEEKQFIW